MRGEVEAALPGAWRVVLDGGSVWIDGSMHPRVEPSGVLAFYERPVRVGGGPGREAPPPLAAFADWMQLERVE